MFPHVVCLLQIQALTSPLSGSPHPTACRSCLQRQSTAASHQDPNSTAVNQCVYCMCVCVCVSERYWGWVGLLSAVHRVQNPIQLHQSALRYTHCVCVYVSTHTICTYTITSTMTARTLVIAWDSWVGVRSRPTTWCMTSLRICHLACTQTWEIENRYRPHTDHNALSPRKPQSPNCFQVFA